MSGEIRYKFRVIGTNGQVIYDGESNGQEYLIHALEHVLQIPDFFEFKCEVIPGDHFGFTYEDRQVT